MSITTGSDQSRVGFTTEGGGDWLVWDRYLTIDGKKAFHLGNICQTCSILFERLGGANSAVSVSEAADALRAGVKSIKDPVVDLIGLGLPTDDYTTCLVDLRLHAVRPGDNDDYFVKEQPALWGIDGFWDLPHDPRVPYYRAGETEIEPSVMLYSIVVPMFPESWLGADGITSYLNEPAARSAIPTAVTLSLLDAKGPAVAEGEVTGPAEHWVLTHYVLDGHHKLAAASRAGRTARLLSFLSLSKGVSSREQIDRAVAILAKEQAEAGL
jgi:hypothetical protein